ncbi:NAD(P)H-binding protein [soil metagenome]
MNVAIAGGTGFLGRHISRALIEAGHHVTVLGRDPARVASVPELAGADALRADVTDERSLAGTLDGSDAVVQAVQFPNHPVEVPSKGLTYDRFDRRGTENLLREASASSVERFFYLSGAGADPASATRWYRAKGRAEQALKASGMRWSILRPSWAYGPEDRALNRLATIARWSPVVPRLGTAVQRVQPVHVDDIARAARRIFERDEAWGKTLEIGGPEVMTMDEIIHTLLEVMGKRRLVLPVPKSLARIATAPLVFLPSPPMTPQGIEFAVQDGIVDTTELRRVLGMEPVGLREGLSRYLRP